MKNIAVVVFLLASVFLSVASASAQGAQGPTVPLLAPNLKGLPGVIIEFGQIPPELTSLGIDEEALRPGVAQALQNAGVHIYGAGDHTASRPAILEIDVVGSSLPKGGLFIYLVTAHVLDAVELAGAPGQRMPAYTWETELLGVCPQDRAINAIQTAVNGGAARFTTDWQWANPQAGSPKQP